MDVRALGQRERLEGAKESVVARGQPRAVLRRERIQRRRALVECDPEMGRVRDDPKLRGGERRIARRRRTKGLATRCRPRHRASPGAPDGRASAPLRRRPRGQASPSRRSRSAQRSASPRGDHGRRRLVGRRATRQHREADEGHDADDREQRDEPPRRTARRRRRLRQHGRRLRRDEAREIVASAQPFAEDDQELGHGSVPIVGRLARSPARRRAARSARCPARVIGGGASRVIAVTSCTPFEELPRQLAGQELVADDGPRELIGARVDDLSAELLGRHVDRRSHRAACVGLERERRGRRMCRRVALERWSDRAARCRSRAPSPRRPRGSSRSRA